MAASRHLLVSLFAALPLAAACQLVLNLDQYQKVDGGEDASPDGIVGSEAGGQDGSLPDAFYEPVAWAKERMPNPAFDSGTNANFNTVSYQPIAEDGGAAPVAVRDMTKAGPNRTWLKTSSGGVATKQDAEAYCAKRTELGKTWRLPTRIELIALIDFTPNAPNFIDPLFTLSQVTLWTSSVYRPYDPDAGVLYWTVDFKAGAVSPSIGSTQSYGALCVLDTTK